MKVRTFVVALAATAAVILLPATPAYAAGTSVSPSAGLSAAGPSTLSVSGSGFQVIEGGFGGIYVLFGTLSGGRRYAGAAYQRFIAFPGSSTEGSANGVMELDGTWFTTLGVPGPIFADQNGGQVNCYTVTCGVMTIGAHGVPNANNETFHSVSFVPAPQPSTTPPVQPTANQPTQNQPTAAPPTTAAATSEVPVAAPGTTTGPATSASTAVAQPSTTGPGLLRWWPLAVALVVLVAGAATGVGLARRRRGTTAAAPDDSSPNTP